MFFWPKAGIFGAAKGKLIFDARTRQIHSQQAGLGAVNVFEGPRKTGGLYRGREPNGMLLAMRMASSKSFARMIASTGPKISSLRWSSLGDIAEHRGLNKEALIAAVIGQAVAAAEQFAAFLFPDLDVAQNGLERGRVHGGRYPCQAASRRQP